VGVVSHNAGRGCECAKEQKSLFAQVLLPSGGAANEIAVRADWNGIGELTASGEVADGSGAEARSVRNEELAPYLTSEDRDRTSPPLNGRGQQSTNRNRSGLRGTRPRQNCLGLARPLARPSGEGYALGYPR